MKKSPTIAKNLTDARAKVKLFEELGNGATLLNKIMASPSTGTDEQRLLRLIKDAGFFVAVRHLDSFSDFLNEMERAEIGLWVPSEVIRTAAAHREVRPTMAL